MDRTEETVYKSSINDPQPSIAIADLQFSIAITDLSIAITDIQPSIAIADLPVLNRETNRARAVNAHKLCLPLCLKSPFRIIRRL